ncbi:hypothetical protein AGOR_G00101540 [Albula goreensis]|uniref:Uncharacterized protein n=1 Tax=Albula goreensis TaxID=1534307 RepID=A0A8T3DFB7_9TELE|nr:hypothetical protein AGOR_G00101540 [Albula goreensis]
MRLLGTMSNCGSVKEQLNSIMVALTNAAVAEINKLFEDSSAVLFLEITRSQRENQALKKKLQLIESELRSAPDTENIEGVSETQSLLANEEDWPADTPEEETPLIKEERPEEDWGGRDPHAQLVSCTERTGAEDLGCSHWMNTPADTQQLPAGGAGELIEDVQWDSDVDTDDSNCSYATGKDSEILPFHPELQRHPSREDRGHTSLPSSGPPGVKTEPGTSRTTAVKEETVAAWSVEVGSRVTHFQGVGPGVIHTREYITGARLPSPAVLLSTPP